MNEPLALALIGVVSAVLGGLVSAVYANGGRAGLERRAAQQELGIAEQLPEGLAKRTLVRHAEDRMLRHLDRRLGPELRRFGWVWITLLLIVQLTLTLLLAAALDQLPPSSWLWPALGFGFLAMAVAFGVSLVQVFVMSQQHSIAQRRQSATDSARERLLKWEQSEVR